MTGYRQDDDAGGFHGPFGRAQGAVKPAPVAPRRAFRELLAVSGGSACVDAMTPELRQRIAGASRLRIIGALLPILR